MKVFRELLHTTPPAQLFHYTSFAALLGIVHSKTLWASHIRFLNDEQDFACGMELARRELVRRREMRGVSSAVQEYLRLLERRLGRLEKEVVFVASFSEMDDLLGQWRGYCPPGKGVSIGFWTSGLRRQALRQQFRLVPAVYDLRLQSELVREVVEDSLGAFHGGTDDADYLISQCALTLAQLAPLLKHQKFSEEREWRMVSDTIAITDPHVRVREGPTRLIPFYEFELTDPGEPLRVGQIRVGPSSNAPLAADGIAAAMAIHRVEYKCVTSTMVPFRDW